MNILLDTHALIWFFDGNVDFGDKARKAVEHPGNTCYVSVVNFWEIAIKLSIGKLDMDFSMEDLQRLVWENGMEVLPIKIEHTFLLRTLPYHHKDPFDRLLFSQALSEQMDIISRDEIFDSYTADQSIQRIWR